MGDATLQNFVNIMYIHTHYMYIYICKHADVYIHTCTNKIKIMKFVTNFMKISLIIVGVTTKQKITASGIKNTVVKI